MCVTQNQGSNLDHLMCPSLSSRSRTARLRVCFNTLVHVLIMMCVMIAHRTDKPSAALRCYSCSQGVQAFPVVALRRRWSASSASSPTACSTRGPHTSWWQSSTCSLHDGGQGLGQCLSASVVMAKNVGETMVPSDAFFPDPGLAAALRTQAAHP